MNIIAYVIVGIALIILLVLILRVVGFIFKIISVCTIIALLFGVIWWQSDSILENITFIDGEKAYELKDSLVNEVNITSQKILFYTTNCSEECITNISFWDIVKNSKDIVIK